MKILQCFRIHKKKHVMKKNIRIINIAVLWIKYNMVIYKRMLPQPVS